MLDDWEVALSSISFPDSQAYVPPNVFGDYPMAMSVATKPVSGGRPHPERRRKFWVRSRQIEESDVPVKDGISFVKKMIQHLLSEFYEGLEEGSTWGDADEHQGIPEFEWMQRGKQVDLHIDNTKTHTYSQHTYLDIDIEMAQAFGLVKFAMSKEPGKPGYWVRGDSLQIRHTALPTLPRPGNHGIMKNGKAVWWQVVNNAAAPGRKAKTYRALRLHSFNDWYITDINDNFDKKFGSATRTLLVYTDVAQSQIVGAGMTDFIREVEYNSKFGGRVLYEPLHLHYIPVRRNVIDVIEVVVGETSGRDTNFAGGTVILTLKFERRSHRR
ncbi:hypothetical protein OS493_032396 [Desmophyllum pertusum]|uniref:Uncharacterized protein n=1 Tax=Desmophyllum pertusum TaxID=174260 RepID=A0A9W9YBG7_9CNID|nr:hypothetical protein OS493_032396 [Desmophyllum pertusum]